MESGDRNKILVNCNKLLSAINWQKIFPKLIEHGMYKSDEKTVKQWLSDSNSSENTRELYLNIRKCGPRAFKSFVQCLREVGHEDLASILSEKRMEFISRGNKKQLSSYNPNIIDMDRNYADKNYESSNMSNTILQRNFSDILIAYSSMSGYESLRDKRTGSWYIQILCEVFMNLAHDTELLRLFQMVVIGGSTYFSILFKLEFMIDCFQTDDRLQTFFTDKRECQTLEIVNYGFNIKYYLNPGFFKNASRGNV